MDLNEKIEQNIKLSYGDFSKKSRDAFRIAEAYAKEYLSDSVTPSHLLLALLHKEVELVDFLEDVHKDYFYLLDWANARVKLLKKAANPVYDISCSAEFNAVLREAENYQMMYGASELTPEFLLAAVVTPGVGFNLEQLKTLPLSPDDVFSGLSVPAKKSSGKRAKADMASSNKGILERYTINKKREIEESDPKPVAVGFEKEIQSIFETLGRKTKSNVLIIGESGVGKTALLEAIVLRVLAGEVPDFLKDTSVFEMDLIAITSEANYKGEIEDRVKKLFGEVAAIDDAILIIEGIEKIFDKSSILSGTAALLQKELDNGSFKLLATTSVEGFSKNIELNKEFTRKIEKLIIEEPDFEMAARILKEVKALYEEHHELKIPEEVALESIRLAKRFMGEKRLPDSAIDLLDRTLSHIHTMNNISAREVALLKEKLNAIKKRSKEQGEEQTRFHLQWLYHEVFHRVSFLLTSQLEEQADFFALENNDKKIKYLSALLKRLDELVKEIRTEAQVADLSVIVAQQTGIPVGKLQSRERDKLINGESILKQRVVGQDHAIKTVLEAIYESRSGLNKKGQPIASVFFLGPTGTGKTELTKALAEFLFQDENAIIRFDMSEFMESHSVATLTGAPAGYIGYEEGGLLVNKIRQKPYSIVLFDEIEKAHPDVFNIFLQIMDEGRIHDKLNRTGDFSNALIVFTSNVGSDHIFKSFESGVIPTSNELKQIMMGHKFKPEFLGRLTEIIPFSPITPEIVLMIFDIHARHLLKTLKDLNITLTIEEETRKQLALSEFSPQLGARPILGIIRNHIRRPLSKMIISGEIGSGSKVTLTQKKGELIWKTHK